MVRGEGTQAVFVTEGTAIPSGNAGARGDRQCGARRMRCRTTSIVIGRSVSIVENRKAFHDYFIEERFEAGVALEGWEVKAIRGGRANLKEAYVVVKNGELMLIGAHISPLTTASTHVSPDPTRTRRLLLHREEINRLIGKVERAGYTLTPIDLHYSKGRVKLAIGLAKGKQHDKRDDQGSRVEPGAAADHARPQCAGRSRETA